MELTQLNDAAKLYYTISEVAGMLNVTPSKIRFWEKEFPFIKPKKNSKGDRRFTKKDIDNLRMVIHLLKEKKYTIAGAKEYLKNEKGRLNKKIAVINKLEEAKRKLERLENTL